MDNRWSRIEVCRSLGMEEEEWPFWLLISADRFSRWHRGYKDRTLSCDQCLYRVDISDSETVCMWGVVDKRLVGVPKRRCEYCGKEKTPRLEWIEHDVKIKWRREKYEWCRWRCGNWLERWDEKVPAVRRRGTKERWMLIHERTADLRIVVGETVWCQPSFGWVIPRRMREKEDTWYNLVG